MADNEAKEKHWRVRCRMKQLSTTLDETTCKMVICQHPMCWESIRRLEKGLPRFAFKSFKASQRPTHITKGDLPMLKVLQFPHWEDLETLCELREMQNAKRAVLFTPTSRHQDNIRYSIPRTDCQFDIASDDSWDITRQHRVMTSPHSHEAHMRSKSTSPTELKKIDVVEVEIEDQKPQSLAEAETILVWVPNRQFRKEWQSDWPREKKAPPLLSVKDIVFQLQQPEDLGGPGGETKSKSTVKSKSLNKVPTGGRPYTLHTLQQPCSNQISPRQLMWSEENATPTELQLTARSAETKSPVVQAPQSLPLSGRVSGKSPTDLLPPEPSTCAAAVPVSTPEPAVPILLAPTHTRVTLHSIKEKQQHITCALTYKGAYRMDEKVGKQDTIDHERMKKQPYLWKKYIQKHGPKPCKEAPGNCSPLPCSPSPSSARHL
ncbi:uncharacterized protein LOC103183092 [Callorhinchus milii]|uniref:uncharacterized protein LOC103183092 n=1 Tax=Callorhinchus milii TaxID=7868 RepID=UPI001C3FE4B1|nr:uncharacterized protein LOC103183092 [Callorhinchus milii]